jgi:hypothetical protein
MSCSQELHIQDRFGASQLVAFRNERNGYPLTFFDESYLFHISEKGINYAALESLITVVTLLDNLDLTQDVEDRIVC